MKNVGLGCENFTIAVYIANKPNMLEYQQLSGVSPLTTGEISTINAACGNGWRKVFNVYAKLLYTLDNTLFSYSASASTWQKYRDNFLLQPSSNTVLLFSSPQPSKHKSSIHIICGKGHAKHLLATGKLTANLIWLDEEFAIDKAQKIVVCPYFDYRQLSNIKIAKLADLLTELNVN